MSVNDRPAAALLSVAGALDAAQANGHPVGVTDTVLDKTDPGVLAKLMDLQ